MKPFNLEEAKAGKPLVTRDGRDAKFIAHVPESVDSSRVVIFLGNEIYVSYEDGSTYSKDESGRDLFMKTVKKTVYVNMWRNDDFSSSWGESETEEIAKIVAGRMLGKKIFAIAIPIEIEE